MNEVKQYNTIKGFSEFTYKEKGSEFIAKACPIEAMDEFQKIIIETKKRYYDASHNCYCVKLIHNIVKYSDDGEPAGTAGIRILSAIEHFQLNNIFVIVTRYFGGTKLGIGPLGKAYFTSAEKAIEKNEIITKKAFERIYIKADFPFVSHIHRVIASLKAQIVDIEYKEEVIFNSLIEPDFVENLKNQLSELSGGQIEVKKTGEYLFL